MEIIDIFRNLENDDELEDEPGNDAHENEAPENTQVQTNLPNNADRGGFVASKKRHKFHRRDCEWAAYILHSQNLVEFSSREEAISKGYKHCRTCDS